MANNLATLRTQLSLKLRDATNATWSTGELDDILTQRAAQLWPRVGVNLTTDFTTIPYQESNSLPATFRSVHRVDVLDVTGLMEYTMPAGTWELRGTPGAYTLFVNRNYVLSGKTMRVFGYGVYDLVTTLPDDRFVPLILAQSASEALRRLIPDRAQFKKWLTRNQEQNVSVNELILMVNEADAEAEKLYQRAWTWKKPVPGRV